MSTLRIVKAARGFHQRYANPSVAALNKANAAKHAERRQFWMNVADYLWKPYPGMAWTKDDVARWTAIRA